MERVNPRWFWSLAAFVIGLLVGWLAIGWGAWPVTYRNALPPDLRTTERDEYLKMVAESFAATDDIASAQKQLETWPRDKLAEELTKLQNSLASENSGQAAQVHSLASALGIAGQPAPFPTPVSLNQTDNILVLGMDTRPELEAWRTDTIMVVAIDHKARQVGVISIPRDLYVDIPGHGKDRINTADYVGEKTKYPGGGPALARRVVEDSLGIPTTHYVRIKQEGLVNLVDALGGVTVTLDCPLYEQTPDESSPGDMRNFTLPAGQVFLDGPTAKKFATYRYIESDFGRVRRQQQLIWAIRNRALQANVLPRIPELWQALADTFTTDLSLPDVIKLASLGAGLRSLDIHGMVLGGDSVDTYTTPEGWEVLVITDQTSIQAKLAQLFASKPLSEAGKHEPGGCPPPPPGFPDLSPTP